MPEDHRPRQDPDYRDHPARQAEYFPDFPRPLSAAEIRKEEEARPGAQDPPRGAAPQFAIGATSWPGLAKLSEECGELVQVIGKLLATGGDVHHWDGSDLGVRLVEEMGDVRAALRYVIAQGPRGAGRAYERRADDKSRLFQRWHDEERARSPS